MRMKAAGLRCACTCKVLGIWLSASYHRLQGAKYLSKYHGKRKAVALRA